MTTEIEEHPTQSIDDDDVGTSTVTFIRTKRVQVREAFVDWTQVLANVLVPIGIFLAGYSFFQQSLENRQDASARQIELFYSVNLTNAQITLYDIWTETDLVVLRLPQKRNFIDAFVERAIDASDIDNREITAAIISLASYFDRVEACIASNSCDAKYILAQIGGYGQDFYCIYSNEIKKLREKSLVANLGKGLASFTERSGGCKLINVKKISGK